MTAQRCIVIYRWYDETAAPTAGARAALGEALAEIGIDGEVKEDSQLALSELVANAAEHATGPYEVRLRSTPVRWICEVEDGDSRMPQLPEFQAAAPFQPAERARGGGLEGLLEVLGERGRGLQIVNYLTLGVWGFQRSPAAKVAWFALPARAVPCAPDATVRKTGVLPWGQLTTARADSPLG